MSEVIFQYEPNEQRTTKDAKSNNAAQDDEQHNVALKQRSQKKHERKTYVCGNHLFRLKERRQKIQGVLFLGQKLT